MVWIIPCALTMQMLKLFTIRPAPRRSNEGFTLIEIMLVVAIVGLVAAMAIPSTAGMMNGYKLKGDAQAVNNLIALAKIRASAQFSRARIYADLNARTVVMQTWNRTTNSWTTEGGTVTLSKGVTFGFGAITVPPPNSQAAIAQSPVCKDKLAADIPNTACVTFNSRGMPVDNSRPPAGGVVGNSALYVTDGAMVYGTTITTTPLIKFWWSSNRNNVWVRQ